MYVCKCIMFVKRPRAILFDRTLCNYCIIIIIYINVIKPSRYIRDNTGILKCVMQAL